jgi:hypothetical protein
VTVLEEKQFMLKKWIFYASLLTCVVFLSLSFKSYEIKNQNWFKVTELDELHFLFPSKEPKAYTSLKIPFTGRFFIGFKEAIGFKESQSNYKKINTLGYMGKYQFGPETLKTIGISDSLAFLNSPKMQEKAFVALVSKNKFELKDEINKYSGKIVAGVKVTESGILAAAHLGGAGSVKKFLHTNGRRKCKDGYGSSVKSYMKSFGGYDTSGIVANNNARVRS